MLDRNKNLFITNTQNHFGLGQEEEVERGGGILGGIGSDATRGLGRGGGGGGGEESDVDGGINFNDDESGSVFDNMLILDEIVSIVQLIAPNNNKKNQSVNNPFVSNNDFEQTCEDFIRKTIIFNMAVVLCSSR